MKKFVLSLMTAAALFSATPAITTEAATVSTYSGVAFKDATVDKQFNYLERTSFLKSVSNNDFKNGINYSHLKVLEEFYTRTEYLKHLSAAYDKGKGFADAMQDLSDNGTPVTNATFVKGKMENGKVVAAEAARFEVISIQ